MSNLASNIAKNVQNENQHATPLDNKSQNDSPIANILIVDDDQQSIRLLLEIFARKSIRGTVAGDTKTALNFLDKNNYDLVLGSIGPDSTKEGFDLVYEVKKNSPDLPVILMCEFNEQKTQSCQQLFDIAVKAIGAGCSNFLSKPLDLEKTENLLNTFLQNHLVSTADCDQQNTQSIYKIVGKSAKLIQVVNLAKKVAPTSAPVLISGESGTGKELISHLVHRNSRRAQGAYIRINCAALNDSLLESELFGHEKGAFTGAHSLRKGRFEMAHGGTLLLDEITETPPKFQAKLLRVLEQQDFERVGGNDTIKVDVRIISTTNKDLLQEVTEGRFRQDLYYRLSGIRLIVPPLRQRSDDLVDLVWHFVNFYARQGQRYIKKLDSAMMDIFKKYHWPGNIRQLRNVVLTSLILGTGPKLSLADVSWLFDELQPRPQENSLSVTSSQTPVSGLGGLPLQQVERRAILDTLQHTSGNQTKAAKILGISDRTLREKVRRYNQMECLQPA